MYTHQHTCSAGMHSQVTHEGLGAGVSWNTRIQHCWQSGEPRYLLPSRSAEAAAGGCTPVHSPRSPARNRSPCSTHQGPWAGSWSASCWQEESSLTSSSLPVTTQGGGGSANTLCSLLCHHPGDRSLPSLVSRQQILNVPDGLAEDSSRLSPSVSSQPLGSHR